MFRFLISIPPTFPDGECPVRSLISLVNQIVLFKQLNILFLKKVQFTSTVYHPQINETTGELDIKRYFPVWK